MSFETQIKEWVNIDNQLKIENDKIKELRERKKILNEKIVGYSNENKLTKAVIEINDSKLKIITTKTINPLSLKYVEGCLKNFIKDEVNLKKMMDYIKENRESKDCVELKRFFNK